MRVVGILLAAGRGSRFGGDKLIAPLSSSAPGAPAGTPLGVAAARNLVAALPDSIAVVRPGDVGLSRLLGATGIRVVECPDADAGMGASLACGACAAADADGWVVALADMPWIEANTLRGLLERLARTDADAVASATDRGPQPMLAAYRRDPALAAVTRLLDAGELRMRALFDILVMEAIDAPVGAAANINEPADLAAVRT